MLKTKFSDGLGGGYTEGSTCYVDYSERRAA